MTIDVFVIGFDAEAVMGLVAAALWAWMDKRRQ